MSCPEPNELNDAALLERFRLAIANAGKDTPPGFEQHWKDCYDILAQELSSLGVQQLAHAALFCDDALKANPEAPKSVIFRLAAEAALRGVVLMVHSARKLDGLPFDSARFGLFACAIAEASLGALPDGVDAHAEFPSAYKPGDFRAYLESEHASSLDMAAEVKLLRARVRELEAGIRRGVELIDEYTKPDWSVRELQEHLLDVLASDVKCIDLAFAMRLASEALDQAGWKAGFVHIISTLANLESPIAKKQEAEGRLGTRLERASIVTSIAEHLRRNL
jgi:hypothetical protein